MGGFMPTPAAPAQPPQVKLDTTATSRGNFNNFLKSMNGASSMTPLAPSGMGAMMPQVAPSPTSDIDIFNTPVQFMFSGGEIDSFVDDQDSGNNFSGGGDNFDDGFTEEEDPGRTGDYQTDDSGIFTGTGDDNQSQIPTVNFTNQSIENAFDALNIPSKTRKELREDLQDRVKNNDLIGALDAAQKDSAEFDSTSLGEKVLNNIIQASNVNPATFSRIAFNQGDILGDAAIRDSLDLSKSQSDTLSPQFDMFGDVIGAKPPNDPSAGLRNVADVLKGGESLTYDPVQNKISFSSADDKRSRSADMNIDQVPFETLERGANTFGGIQAGLNLDNTLVDEGFLPVGEFDVLSPAVGKATDRGARFGEALANDFLSARRMPGTAVDDFLNPATVTQNISPENTAARIARNNRSIDQILSDMRQKTDLQSQVNQRFRDAGVNISDVGNIGNINRADLADIIDGNIGIDPSIQARINEQSELDQAPSSNKLGFASNIDPRDETFRNMVESGGRGIPEVIDTSPTPTDFEEQVGLPFSDSRMRDIERLLNVPAGQRRTGEGDDPNTLAGLPTALNAFETIPREQMAIDVALGRPRGLGEMFTGVTAPNLQTETMKQFTDRLQRNIIGPEGDTTSFSAKSIPEQQFVRNDSGRITGIRDASGRLITGVDPNQQIFGDDGPGQIIRPIIPAKEEEDLTKKPPNVIGGIEPPFDPEIKPPTVVPSPFARVTSKIDPVSFDSGQLNKLIELLTGVPAKPIVSAAEGGLIRAVDNFLSTGQ